MTGRPISELIEEYEEQAKYLEAKIEEKHKEVGYIPFDESKELKALYEMLRDVRESIFNMRKYL